MLLFSHRSQPNDLQTAFAQINSYQAPLIYQKPEDALRIAELATHKETILGVFSVDEAVLARFAQDQAAVWVLAEDQAAFETYFLQSYSPALNQTIGSYQLRLYAQTLANEEMQAIHYPEGVSLQGKSLSPELKPQAPYALTLRWQSDKPLEANYHVFIHLLHLVDQDETVIAQSDGQPANWQRPSTTWAVGENIKDPHALWLGDLPPGSYQLRGGLYRPESGERLRLESGEDFIALGQFILEP